MEEKTSPKKVRIDYIEPAELKSHYAHGVFGGISPHGELVLKFYQDGLKTPRAADITVDDKGRSIKEEQLYEETGSKIERKILVEIILNPDTALSIAGWIQNKVKELQNGRLK